MANLELPKQSLDDETIGQLFFANEGLRPFRDGRARLLLVLQHMHLAAPREECESASSSLIAINSRLSWIVYGGLEDVSSAAGLKFRVCNAATDIDNIT